MFDQCLYFNTTVLARLVDKEWGRAFKPFGLTPSQGFMLRWILDQSGRSQYEIANGLTISRPTATRILDGLQLLGLVERRNSGADGRHWEIFPTSKARSIEAEIKAASAEVTKRIQKQIGKDNFVETVERVKSVCSALR